MLTKPDPKHTEPNPERALRELICALDRYQDRPYPRPNLFCEPEFASALQEARTTVKALERQEFERTVVNSPSPSLLSEIVRNGTRCPDCGQTRCGTDCPSRI